MAFFRWAAPLFGRFADRWSEADIARIAELLRPHVPEGGRVLDLGGGTGALAVRIADATGAHVTVLDPTPEMIAYVPEHARVTACLGAAEDIPFGDSSFDALLTTDAFHHFGDQEAAADEMARVVRCGGVLLVEEFDPRPLLMRGVVLGERLLGEPGSFFAPDEMCAFWARRGVEGDCAKTKGVSYRFTGVVRPR